MSRWSGEMEFEFIETEGESGSFVATEKILQFLRNHLAKGQVDDAVRLYEDAGANVAEGLIDESKSASSNSQNALAEMFQKARDFKNSAAVLEIARRHEQAASLYEKAQDFAGAGRCWEALSNHVRAGQAYERAGEVDKARELYEMAGPSVALAECLARQNHHLDAAEIYRKLGNLRGEIDMLRLVSVLHAARVPAVMRLGELLLQFGRPDEAVALLVDTVRQCKAASKHQPLYMALAKILESLGRNAEAQQVRERISNILSGTVMEKQKQLSSQAGVAPIGTVAVGAGVESPAPISSPTLAKTANAATLEQEEYSSADPFSGLVDPFGGPQKAETAQNKSQAPAAVPVVDQAYTHLKGIPIFAELDLQDMKDLYRTCQQVQYPAGQTLIEQGHAGAGLLVVVQGQVAVLHVDEVGDATPLAELGPGQYVGEISLIDDAPTSARVLAKSPVNALFIARDRFHQFLYGRDVAAMRIFRLFTRTLADRLRQSNLRK